MYNKEVSPDEYEMRKGIFDKEVEEINRHNMKNVGWTKGVNHMTDMTKNEFKMRLGLKKGLPNLDESMIEELGQDDIQRVSNMATTGSWKANMGYVEDQGGCGSCWAFASIGVLQGCYNIATNKSLSLSVQQMVDCTPNPDSCGGTGGCDGATNDLLFEYAKEEGVISEDKYAYMASTGTCDDDQDKVMKFDESHVVKSNDYTALMAAVAQGPVAISVAANKWSSYNGGVMKFKHCDADVDHAVILTGWGETSDGEKYWEVRNSWGRSWGEDGYIRLERDENDSTKCKQDTSPLDGVGCPKDNLNEVTVCGTCGILYASSYVTGCRDA